MNNTPMHGEKLVIDRLGQRGEGIAQGPDGLVFTPYALPGDVILADIEGERGTLLEVLEPSKDRLPAFCPHYGTCGGCAVQALSPSPYADWKRDLVVQALRHSKIETNVSPMLDGHGQGRRRATFHARILRDALGRVRVDVGFMKARAHDIVNIEACPVLAPEMGGAARAAHALARALSSLGKPLDILITATQTGLDVDVRGCGELEEGPRRALIAEAARLDLARVSNHGQVVIERRPPVLPMGRAVLQPPPGAFLQATQAGEELLAQLALDRAGKARRVLDLFSGVGTFALRLAEKATVHAVENDRAALTALIRASGDAGPALKPITTDVRDLFKRPLPVLDLEAFDVVLFDPPRAGAEAQAREIALSKVPVVIGVSCNVQTFARDARILIDGGYSLDEVTPVDQFRHSAHVEMVATFRKQRVTGQTKGKGNRKRLLG